MIHDIKKFGRYSILKELERMGSCHAYLAERKSLGQVVLKFLEPSRSLTRFRQLAETLGEIRDPRIARIHDFGRFGKLDYLVMEYCQGSTLEEAVGWAKIEAPRYDLHTAVSIVSELAEAVETIHNHGRIHRDLHPAIITLDEDQNPKITDLGLAGGQEWQTQSSPEGNFSGASYQAPEQLCAGKKIGPQVDVFALGVMLYEMLALEHPFSGANRLETEKAILKCEPTDLRKRNAEVSAELAAIVTKAMQRSPKHRYARAIDLAEDLQAFLGGQTVLARSPGMLGKTLRWFSYRPRAVAAGILAFTLGVGATGLQYAQQLALTEEIHSMEVDPTRPTLEQIDLANELNPSLGKVVQMFGGGGRFPQGGKDEVSGLLGNIFEMKGPMAGSSGRKVPEAPQNSRIQIRRGGGVGMGVKGKH